MKTLANKFKIFALITLLSSSPSIVSADKLIETIYFGIGVTQTDLQVNEPSIRSISSASSQSSLESSELGYSVFIGAKLDQYLSIEMGYIDFGNFSAETNTQKSKLFSANSVHITSSLNYPINQTFNIYAKAGFSGWQTQSDISALKGDGTGLVYGAGIDINLYNSNHRTLQIEWLHQEFDDLILTTSDSVSASLVFSF